VPSPVPVFRPSLTPILLPAGIAVPGLGEEEPTTRWVRRWCFRPFGLVTFPREQSAAPIAMRACARVLPTRRGARHLPSGAGNGLSGLVVGTKEAVTSVSALKETSQDPVPEHPPPDQPPKAEPVAGVAISFTTVPSP
jgi:hypothetical protein